MGTRETLLGKRKVMLPGLQNHGKSKKCVDECVDEDAVYVVVWNSCLMSV